MSEDQTNLKENPKEAVKAAIQALRSKGAEINPYTVANEAGLPRSAIYRNAELMDLISREKMEPTEKLAPTSDAFTDRVAELESEVEKLGQQIWNLEKQNEELQKDFNDAWNMGFAAGLEEAAKRYARGPVPTGSPPPKTELSPWPSVERNAANQAAADAFLSGAVQQVASVIGATAEHVFSNNENSEDDSPGLFIDFSLSSEQEAETSEPEETSGSLEREAGTASVAPGTGGAIEPMTAKEAAEIGITTPGTISSGEAHKALKNEPARNGVAHAVAASLAETSIGTGADPGTEGVLNEAVISDHVIFADPVANELPYFSDEMSLTSAQELLYSPEILQAISDQTAFASEPSLHPSGVSGKPEQSLPGGNLEYSQRASDVAAHSGKGVESGSNFPAMEIGPRLTPAASALATRHDYQATGIYNVARSGPYVASDFNPLIELSWKDIEDVYNYRASTLKDYAKNVPSAPSSFNAVIPPAQPQSSNNGMEDTIPPGNNLHDSEIVLPSDEEIAHLQDLETAVLLENVEAAVFMTEEEAEVKEEPMRADEREMVSFGRPQIDDPNRTGDRLQAMPSNRFVDDAGVVDLDALDIFDNLDEWIDVNKLSAQDAVSPKTAPEPADPGAEYRELIKSRYKQASEMAAEPAKSPVAGKPAEGAGAHQAGNLAESIPPRTARNKFVGGKASQEAAPPPQSTFVAKQVPPEIRKACLILGVRQEELTEKLVLESWKRQIVEVHPDKGGDHEAAIYLNTAKETLIRWLDQQAPKLGAKFMKQEPKGPEKKKD